MAAQQDDQREAPETPHVLAFYLPQFHQVPENDAWHDVGFTEWTVVSRSRPLFPGHRQPDLPGELGFYDLRVPETRYRQAKLARDHGVTGFLYYHYWFGGRRMLGRPLDEVLASGQPDFPFALCWADESWYRRWQGTSDEMLMEQVFSEEDDVAHIRWLIECFKDPRYIRIKGRPLLTVYRANSLPEPSRTVKVWRDECEKAGVPPPWLVAFETDAEIGDPGQIDFDASAEFVPHMLHTLVDDSSRMELPNNHRAFPYDEVARAYMRRRPVDWTRYPCVATGWDNSPRRQTGDALILHNATPAGYGRWLEAAVSDDAARDRDGIVFINAWNEWAEGAHLEPDDHWGRAYLETTRDVLREVHGNAVPLGPPLVPEHGEPTSIADNYDDLYEAFVALQRRASGYLSYLDRRLMEQHSNFSAEIERQRNEARSIAELNEMMAGHIEILTQRIRELGADVPTPTWTLGP